MLGAPQPPQGAVHPVLRRDVGALLLLRHAQALLIFYLTQHFLFDDKFAQGRYGAYTAPRLSGAADRRDRRRQVARHAQGGGCSVALLLVAGHFTMGIEGAPAVQTRTVSAGTSTSSWSTGRMENAPGLPEGGRGLLPGRTSGGQRDCRSRACRPGGPLPQVLPKGSYAFGGRRTVSPITSNIMYLALSLIIMGVGFLKANISSIVGQLYETGRPEARSWVHALLLRHQPRSLPGPRCCSGLVSAWACR